MGGYFVLSFETCLESFSMSSALIPLLRVLRTEIEKRKKESHDQKLDLPHSIISVASIHTRTRNANPQGRAEKGGGGERGDSIDLKP